VNRRLLCCRKLNFSSYRTASHLLPNLIRTRSIRVAKSVNSYGFEQLVRFWFRWTKMMKVAFNLIQVEHRVAFQNPKFVFLVCPIIGTFLFCDRSGEADSR